LKCSPVTAREILPSDPPLLDQGLPPVYQDDEDEEEGNGGGVLGVRDANVLK